MKSVYLLVSALMLTVFISSCGKDPDKKDDPTKTDNTVTEPFPSDMDEYITALTGSTKDSSEKTWIGYKAYRKYWNRETQEYGEEGEVTDDPDIQFTKMSLIMKYDQYTSERLGYNLGSLKWIDPMGKSGMNWEIENATPDTIYVNQGAVTEQNWAIIRLNTKEFEFSKKWKSGGSRFIERVIWRKK